MNVSNVIVVDITPPVAVITSPANGLLGNSKSVKVNVSATDNIGVTQVSIYIDGILQSTLSAAPYSYNWNTRRLTSGTHIITAKAWDAAGNAGLATPISVIK